jgi:hypothetical protein
MRVYQVRDGIGAKIRESLGDLGTRRIDTAIDEHFAIGPGQNGDVSPRALKRGDVISQLMRDDG